MEKISIVSDPSGESVFFVRLEPLTVSAIQWTDGKPIVQLNFHKVPLDSTMVVVQVYRRGWERNIDALERRMQAAKVPVAEQFVVLGLVIATIDRWEQDWLDASYDSQWAS
jgi:hypothetical protein